MDKHREEKEKKRIVKLKKEQEKAELEEKKKQNLEKRRVVQYLHGFGGQQQQSGGRDNKTKAKLAAKLAERKKVNQPEKEALRAQLIQEAQNAQLEMEARQAERIVLEERLRQFQARLERELVEAAEYAAQKFLEKEERREWEERERMMRIQEEIRMEEQVQQKKLEEQSVLIQEEKQESHPSPITYKQAVMARLEQYEIARFAFLELLKKKYYEKQMQMEIARQLEECEAAERRMEKEEEERLREEKLEMNKKIVQEYLMETKAHESEESTSQHKQNEEYAVTSGAKAVLKRDTSIERALKERVLRKLKVKLEKRIMMKRQEKQEEEILKNEYAEDQEEDYGSWNREDKMEQAQYMRRGYGRGF